MGTSRGFWTENTGTQGGLVRNGGAVPRAFGGLDRAGGECEALVACIYCDFVNIHCWLQGLV